MSNAPKSRKINSGQRAQRLLTGCPVCGGKIIGRDRKPRIDPITGQPKYAGSYDACENSYKGRRSTHTYYINRNGIAYYEANVGAALPGWTPPVKKARVRKS